MSGRSLVGAVTSGGNYSAALAPTMAAAAVTTYYVDEI